MGSAKKKARFPKPPYIDERTPEERRRPPDGNWDPVAVRAAVAATAATRELEEACARAIKADREAISYARTLSKSTWRALRLTLEEWRGLPEGVRRVALVKMGWKGVQPHVFHEIFTGPAKAKRR